MNSDGTVRPHVFMTRDLEQARLFSLKSKHGMVTRLTDNPDDFPYVVYAVRPENLGTGHIYAITQDHYAPFEEIVVRGRPTGKFVSYQMVDVSAGPIEIVHGIEDLMRRDVQVFYLPHPQGRAAFHEAWNKVRGKSARYHHEFINTERQQGRLLHMNAEVGINPHVLQGAAPVRRDPAQQVIRIKADCN